MPKKENVCRSNIGLALKNSEYCDCMVSSTKPILWYPVRQITSWRLITAANAIKSNMRLAASRTLHTFLLRGRQPHCVPQMAAKQRSTSIKLYTVCMRLAASLVQNCMHMRPAQFKLHTLAASLVQIACTVGQPGSNCMHCRPVWFKLHALAASLVQISCTGGQPAWLRLHALAASLVQIACTGGQTAQKRCIRLTASRSLYSICMRLTVSLVFYGENPVHTHCIPQQYIPTCKKIQDYVIVVHGTVYKVSKYVI